MESTKLSQCPVFEVFKKKIVTVDDAKMELPFQFLKTSTSVDPRRNLAPTKSSLSDTKG